MKVLFLTHHLKGNDGWSRYAKDLILQLQNCNVEVLCLVQDIVPSIPVTQIAILNDPIKYVSNPLEVVKTALKVRKIVEDYKPDLVHVIVEPYGHILQFLKKDFREILTVHSTYAFMPILVSGWRKIVSNYLAKRMYRRIDEVIAVSEYTKNHLLKYVSLAKDKVCVVSGGVELSKFKKEGKPRTKHSKKQILFVGAVKPRKGLLEAIEALRFVTHDFLYRIVGTHKENDPYVKILKQKVSEYGLEAKVMWEGRIEEDRLTSLYAEADLFLMLSTNNGADFEGYGLVYIEASAYGVPCIGPRDSGVSDAIDDRKSGFLVDQYDARVVAQRIDEVLGGNMIKAQDCINWAMKNSAEIKARQVFELYKKTLA